MAKVLLSTKDNPFNPFTNFDAWFSYDQRHGHHSCEYLARIAKTSHDLSDSDNEEAVENAVDDIIKYDPFGIYIKVEKPSKVSKRIEA